MEYEFENLISNFYDVVRNNGVNRITVATNGLPLDWKRAVITTATMKAFDDGLSPNVIQHLASQCGLRYAPVAPGIYSLRRV